MNFETEPDESGDELHPYDEPYSDEDDNDDDGTGYIEPLTYHQGESDDTGYLEPLTHQQGGSDDTGYLEPITDQGENDDGSGYLDFFMDENVTGYKEPLSVQEVGYSHETGVVFYPMNDVQNLLTLTHQQPQSKPQ